MNFQVATQNKFHKGNEINKDLVKVINRRCRDSQKDWNANKANKTPASENHTPLNSGNEDFDDEDDDNNSSMEDD
jgi:hypothetical protein